MPKSLDNQLSYQGGEFSPLLDARVDHPRYASACRQLQNMIALRHGGCTRRPGTIFKALTKYQDSDVYRYAARLMKFQFSPTTSFVLEFGHQYIRFFSNQQQVELSSAPLWVAATPYVVGRFVEDPGDANNLYYCIFPVTSAIQPHADPVHWSRQDAYEIPSPYNGRTTGTRKLLWDNTQVWAIVACQINDVVYLVHPDYPVYKLERFADTDWRLSIVEFLTPAMLDLNATGIMLAGSAVVGAAITVTASAVAWAAATRYRVGQSVSSGGLLYTAIIEHTSVVFATELAAGDWKLETIFSGGNVGGYFQINHVRNSATTSLALTGTGTTAAVTTMGKCLFETFGTWTGTVDLEQSDDLGATWFKVRTIVSAADHNGSIEVNVTGSAQFRLNMSAYTSSTGAPRASFTTLDTVANGLVKITAVASAYSATALVVKELFSTGTTKLWAEGAWSERRGYPQAVTAFQQRMIYGGSFYEQQRIWGSQTDDLENFDRGDGTLATDSFAFDLAAVGRGRIEWLIGQVDLFVGFSGAEWIVNAGQGSFGGSGEPITPQQINAGEHSAWGSCPGVPPILVGNTVLYPQRAARTIQQMTFSVYTNKYESNDLTSLSQHLFGKGVAQMDYQPEFRDQGMLWTITKAGSLCGMTHDMQSEVFAWSRHITGGASTGQRFESVAVINGQGTDDDEVWVVAYRGSTCVELMNPDNWETEANAVLGVAQPNQSLAFYVDSGVSFTGPVSNVFAGFNHLIGQPVVGLINGKLPFTEVVVAGDGTVTVEGFVPGVDPDIVHIGLPIYYAVQGMRLDVDGRAGIIVGVTKALSKVFLRVFNSLSGKILGNGTKEIPIQYRTQALPIDQGPALFTGQKEVTPESTQTDNPVMVVQGHDPLPLTLLATTVRVGITGSP